MVSQVNRLPRGGLIDRTSALPFTFDGITFHGHSGDTLASALLANGVDVVARSFKYHRPRGVFAEWVEEPSAFARIGSGSRVEPNVAVTCQELYTGLRAASQNAWPSLRHDIGSLAGAFAGLLPPGFYYKTFIAPRGAWRVYEWLIRRAAGIGRVPELPDGDRYAKRFAHTDVLVVGAGPAGLTAALTAARSGVSVTLVDDRALPGGTLPNGPIRIAHVEGWRWAARTVAELRSMPNVRVLSRSTVFGHYEAGFFTVLERITDHIAVPPPESPRHRLWKLRARRAILATGSVERPMVLPGNDKPGVMLASAVAGYAWRYGVMAGQSIVLVTNNDGGYGTAAALAGAGLAPIALVDTRVQAGEAARQTAEVLRVKVYLGACVSRVAGRQRVRSVEIRSITGGTTVSIECDVLALAGGWTPSLQLHLQGRGVTRFDPELSCLLPLTGANWEVAGAAAGDFDTAACLRAGACAAIRTVEALGHRVALAEDEPVEGEGAVCSSAQPWAGWPAARGQFVDLATDATAADIALAVREQFRSIEHVKRYTMVGMGPDQGRTSSLNAQSVLSQFREEEPQRIGLTTARPPVSPVSFGSMAGPEKGEGIAPRRWLPAARCHTAAGAITEELGGWMRPVAFPAAGERRQEAMAREARLVRQTVGVYDNSALSKLLVRGPDSGIFLDRVWSVALSDLPVGRCRYGLVLEDSGVVIDDGLVGRLGRQTWFVTSTSAGASRKLLRLEYLLQCEWPELRVHITSLTHQLGNVTLAGPLARNLLGTLAPGLPIDSTSFPYRAIRQGTIGGASGIVMRAGYTGELSFEINVPCSHLPGLWCRAVEEALILGGGPYGLDAADVLRIEKGYIAIGYETDGSVTPLDLGLDRLLAKRKDDFIGRRSLRLPGLTEPGRRQLVGLAANTLNSLPLGSHIASIDSAAGYVTSSAMSPTLGRPVALALVQNGRSRMGETVSVMVLGATPVPCRIVSSCFWDPEGERQHV